MESLVFFAIFSFGVFLAVRTAAEKIREAMKTSAAAPSPLPRRTGRGRSARASVVSPAVAADDDAEFRSPQTPVPAQERLVVTRPARASVHFDFKGKAALRRAMVAREVLGPPLSLRPPRF